MNADIVLVVTAVSRAPAQRTRRADGRSEQRSACGTGRNRPRCTYSLLRRGAPLAWPVIGGRQQQPTRPRDTAAAAGLPAYASCE
eukprot:362866-Chlamydomonas_euryale.AAC.26